MTGPEHYRMAEQLADEAHQMSAQAQGQRAALLAEAQVHATLAGVAVALQAYLDVPGKVTRAWEETLGLAEPG